MRSKSFIVKVLFLFIIITICYYISLFLLYMPKLKKDNINITISDLKNVSEIIKYSIITSLYEEKYDELDFYFKEISKNMNIRITLIALDGRVISDSNEKPEFMDNHLNRPEVQEALKNSLGISIRDSKTLKKEMLYIAEKLTYNNKDLAILRISCFLTDIKRNIYRNIINIIIFSLFIFIISIFLIYTIYYNIKKNINEFSKLSKEIADGNFDVKFKGSDDYESQQLRISFNNMVAKLKDVFKELLTKKEEVENILSSIKEGIILLDNEGIIVSCNESFKRIIKNNNPEKKYYWEVIRNKDFESILNSNSNIFKTINIYDLELIVSVSKIVSSNKTIVIFYDITESVRLERQKKEFIANASHELNTPLTSISGYIETLLDEEKDPEKIKYYTIIQKQTKRLINLVYDLLQLSQLDEKKSIDFKQVNLNNLVENMLPIFKKKINGKGLKINFISQENNINITGNEEKLQQMFINLVDNAIKYTNKGEINILINDKDNNIEIIIEDTGIGIPEKDIPNIFERFYVVDKSRTRENGGTGLGLSIVKSVVDLHKGSINVDSREGVGTKFIIYLPKN